MLFAMPTTVCGQFSLKKINDSTVYAYLQSKHNISVDPMIPDTIDGYTRSPSQHIESVGVTYQKIVDSFSVINGEGFNNDHAFETAFANGSFTISQQNRCYLSNFFLFERDTLKKEWLEFNSNKKSFVYRRDVEVKKYVPWLRVGIFFVVFLLICISFATSSEAKIKLGDNKIKEAAVFSFLSNIIFGGIPFIFIFYGTGSYIEVPFIERLLCWVIRWAVAFVIFLIFLKRQKS